jgi:hypothetical protein
MRLTPADFSGWLTLTVTTVILMVAHVLHLAIIVRAPRPVVVAMCAVVTLTAIVLAGREPREGVALAARRYAAAARGTLKATTIRSEIDHLGVG